MDNWYVLRSVPGKEETAVELLRKTVDPELWDVCTVLKKQKLFRTDGKLILDTELMFPGFVFVKTDQMEKLAEVLERSREYPQPVGGKNVQSGLKRKICTFFNKSVENGWMFQWDYRKSKRMTREI